jgi:hypothetical protein
MPASLNLIVRRRDGRTIMIAVPSSIDVIRQRPQFYFPQGVTPVAICSCLVGDAMELGAAHVIVDRLDQWHIVSADADWLRLPQDRVVAMDRLFLGMQVHPSRVNAVRSEIFVGAFSVAAYVATPDEVIPVVGSHPLPEAVSRVLCPSPCIRSVAFLFGDV